jgi:hypothetical protein
MATKIPIGRYRPGCGQLKSHQYQKLETCAVCGKRFRMIHGLQKWCPPCRIKHNPTYAKKYAKMKKEFDKKIEKDG